MKQRDPRAGWFSSTLHSIFRPQSFQQMAYLRQMMRDQRNNFIMETPLADWEVVVFDLETTGFQAGGGDEILSFGAIAVKGGVIQEEETFYTLVNPDRPILPHISALTGIQETDVQEAPSVMEGMQQFFKFVGRRTLVAHASGHDKQFLNASLWQKSRLRMTHRVLDTMMIAKWLEPERGDYSLESLLEQHAIPITVRHHALEDSKMTAKLWAAYLRRIRERNIHTVGDLYAYLSRN